MTDVTSDELATLFGVTARTVRKLASDGLIVRQGRGLYDRDASVTRYVTHLRDVAAAHTSRDGQLDVVQEGALLKRSQRELYELKKAEVQGRLIPIESIQPAWARVALAVRSSVMAIPGRLASALPHLTAHDREAADTICRDALENAGAVLTAPGYAAGTPEP